MKNVEIKVNVDKKKLMSAVAACTLVASAVNPIAVRAMGEESRDIVSGAYYSNGQISGGQTSGGTSSPDQTPDTPDQTPDTPDQTPDTPDTDKTTPVVKPTEEVVGDINKAEEGDTVEVVLDANTPVVDPSILQAAHDKGVIIELKTNNGATITIDGKDIKDASGFDATTEVNSDESTGTVSFGFSNATQLPGTVKVDFKANGNPFGLKVGETVNLNVASTTSRNRNTEEKPTAFFDGTNTFISYTTNDASVVTFTVAKDGGNTDGDNNNGGNTGGDNNNGGNTGGDNNNGGNTGGDNNNGGNTGGDNNNGGNTGGDNNNGGNTGGDNNNGGEDTDGDDITDEDKGEDIVVDGDKGNTDTGSKEESTQKGPNTGDTTNATAFGFSLLLAGVAMFFSRKRNVEKAK